MQDEAGRWYVPDTNRLADLEKLREKALLKEFEEYQNSTERLSRFRTEAVRCGFKLCWKGADYQAIIDVADRLPVTALQEDPTILMYYNNALTRKGE